MADVSGAGSLHYEDSVSLARSKDPAERARVACSEDVPPEILFFLANDPNTRVRCSIAANRKTPSKADLILATDQDVAVRQHLAHKVAELMPDLDHSEQQAAEQRLFETLEFLARDKATEVRSILAETLKHSKHVPDTVIKRLAHDVDDFVALPILEFSPLLEDAELISIIRGDCGNDRLCAISRRNGLSADVSDAIVARDYEPAIAELLDNHSAQIRENTLDALVNRAATVTSWQAPLIRRPKLPPRTLRKLTGFVARNLLDQLLEDDDLDQETLDAIRNEVRSRLDEDGEDSDAQVAEEQPSAPPAPAKPLTREELQKAISAGDREIIRANLIARSKLQDDVVDRILDSKNPMAVTALTWKSGLTMQFSVQLQLHICGVAPGDVLKENRSGIFPMTPEEMNWQIDFFESSYGWRSEWKSAGGVGR